MAKKFFLIVVLVTLTLLAFSSCNNTTTNDNNGGGTDTSPSNHTHSYGDWQIVKKATCTTDGSEERVCSCGKKEVASIAKIDHSYGEWEIVQEATCTTDGSEERVCSCGKKEVRSSASYGHFEVIDAAVEAGCYNYGLTQGSHCGNCGITMIEQTEIEPKHYAPYGICYECNEVTDGDLAANTYVSIRSNALNTYVTTYYNGSLHIKYHFYDYNLDISISNTYDGKVFIYVTLDLTAEVIDYGPYYSGTGFVEYDVRMNGYSIRDGHTSVSYNAASISWSTTLSSIDYVEFELYLSNYYM